MLGRRRDVLVTEPVGSVRELNDAIAAQLYDASRPSPTNLDGLADMLREFRITRITCTFWMMTRADTRRTERVFDDLGVELVR